MTASTSTDSFKVSIDGTVVDVDPSDFDRFEWRELKRLLGMTQMQLLAALAELDLDAIAGMVWLVRRREDPEVVLDDTRPRRAMPPPRLRRALRSQLPALTSFYGFKPWELDRLTDGELSE